jgi:hypothetical protein
MSGELTDLLISRSQTLDASVVREAENMRLDVAWESGTNLGGNELN